MADGRHAKKRAAQAEERLAGEQERLLAKEERQKGMMQKDVETQRIATMRSRFGGQAPEATANTGNTADAAAGGTPAISDSTVTEKYKTPNRLNSRDPMRSTIFNMRLDKDDSKAGVMQ